MPNKCKRQDKVEDEDDMIFCTVSEVVVESIGPSWMPYILGLDVLVPQVRPLRGADSHQDPRTRLGFAPLRDRVQPCEAPAS